MPGVVRIRVVIVDDHGLMRDGTRKIVEQTGEIVVVGEAANGEEALRVVGGLCPDVVLMDVAMPGLNGIETTRLLKSICPTSAVLGLTAFDDDPYVFALLEAGAAGYLLKTVRGTELVSGIKAIHAGESVLSPSIARKVVGRFASQPGAAHASQGENPLTDRERTILLLAAGGLTNKAIAREMALSPRTVQLHLIRIFEKLGVASRTEAVVMCLRRGWLTLGEIT